MINWKLRIQNKVTLTSLVTMCTCMVYTLLSALDIVPQIEENTMKDLLMMLVEVLALIGIVVDPTTEGFNDSRLAMLRKQPKPDDNV